MPLADQFWGDRYGTVKDPFGHSWSIGGPVKKNRTFFFADFDVGRDRSPVDLIATVPTELQKRGDFSQTFNRDGALRLRTADGRIHLVHAGDIFLL